MKKLPIILKGYCRKLEELEELEELAELVVYILFHQGPSVTFFPLRLLPPTIPVLIPSRSLLQSGNHQLRTEQNSSTNITSTHPNLPHPNLP